MHKLSIQLLILLLQVGYGYARTGQPLEQILQQEALRNLEKLSAEPVPAYYISYRVEERQVEGIGSKFGEVAGYNRQRNRLIQIRVRVGSPQLDNTHEIKESDSGANASVGVYELPLDNNEEAIRLTVWKFTDQLYKGAVQRFLNVKANVAVKVASEDKSPDFSAEVVEQYSEKPIAFGSLKFDREAWEKKVRSYSAVFKDNPDLIDGTASMEVNLCRFYFVDTEGASISRNQTEYRISLNAEAVAADGMQLPLYQNFYAPVFSGLPADKTVREEARNLSEMLSRLKQAPLADTYTGPALLSAEAAGVFFHEFFGHRLEGARMKQEGDAQTFKKKVGEPVLPEDMSVYFDPTLRTYKKHWLSGNYVFDDEGVRARRVTAVENGKLLNFLMSRTPIDGFPNSNGHGRGMIYLTPVSRQSNMLVETSRPHTDEQLRALLLEELKKQGKPYGYLFGKVSGGFTMTSRYSPNAFNVNPLVVYRIYADGRPDELVRGVNMIGTPLSVFAQIAACGDKVDVFNGYCGAESGNIPVACAAPALFVKTIETQRQAKSQSQPPILPRP